MSGRLLIVSNRLPVKLEGETARHFRVSVGGVATGLGSFYREYGAAWIGWPGLVPKEQERDVAARLGELDCHPLFLPPRLASRYYEGFANRTVWPLFHSFPAYATYSSVDWEGYKEVNVLFGERLAEVARPGDTVWVHDYHLMLLPKYLRDRLADVSIGFFLHIPFPQYDVLRLLPWHREIVKGLLAADLIGFHTYDYADAFLRTVRRLFGVDNDMGRIVVGRRVVQVDVFPMGIDYAKFANAEDDPDVQGEVAKVGKRIGSHKLILSVARLDYIKGVPQHLEAFDTFLRNHPEWRGNVVYALVVVPSREKVPHYAALKKEIDKRVGEINSTYGTVDWTPIRYVYRQLTSSELMALYATANVALVMPLRDGMNLVSKEFVAASPEGKGVLILSEMAGSSKELREALIRNPNNAEEVAKALHAALQMPEEERRRRAAAMKKRLEAFDTRRWAHGFLQRLSGIVDLSRDLSAKLLTRETRGQLVDRFAKASRRLLLLDYDGTLVPFADEPPMAEPTDEVLGLLRGLSSSPANEVVLVSGRDRDTLDRWFRNVNLTTVAEHGAWVKPKEAGQWSPVGEADRSWKAQVRPTLEQFVNRVPGSFVEEKDVSLAWHYRKADVESGPDAAKELADTLIDLTANLDINVLLGHKVVEARSSGVSKGAYYSRHLAKGPWDFIFAVGDDWTDEGLFKALPKTSYSVRVGFTPSAARFNLEGPDEVVSLLGDFAATAK